jgi:hypothetical protein
MIVMLVMLLTGERIFSAVEIALQSTQLSLQLFEGLSFLHLARMVFQIAAPSALFFPQNVFCRVHIGSL